MKAGELQEAIYAQLANYEIDLMEATDEEVERARIKMAKLLTSKAEVYAKQENKLTAKTTDYNVLSGAMQIATDENKELKELLESAKAGIEWHISEYPEIDHKADYEMIEEIDKALKK